MKRAHFERHYVNRLGWLRAAVLGANDGIVSLASLLVGVAATHVSAREIMVTGIAALVAGAMSMAAGEFVSVSSQRDAEHSDLERERRELAADEGSERSELAGIYVQRGLTPALAQQVAQQLMAHDALAAHARDELGLSSTQAAQPLQAALASGASFALGAVLPLLIAVLTPRAGMEMAIAAVSLASLALLGALAARAGGASMLSGLRRVLLWGVLAMAVTAAAGRLVGSFA